MNVMQIYSICSYFQHRGISNGKSISATSKQIIGSIVDFEMYFWVNRNIFFPTLNSVKKETYACVFFSKMHLIHAFCFKYFAGV